MRRLLIILLSIYSCNSFAQINLSDNAEISVITCGPYQGEVYSAFGHSAFRVYDPTNEIDEAFNYGIFDFNQPNFYLNFARGYLNYKLGVHSYQDFKNHYIDHNRYVHEQVLDLTPAQKQKLFNYLIWNAKPENQSYFYDYFYNNCATKIRDVIATVFEQEVNFDGSYIKTNYSIRDLTDIYLQQQPWGDLGIDIGLGLPMDKKASPYEYMFLPDYIQSGFDHATIKQNSTSIHLVKKTINVFDSLPQDIKGDFPKPIYIFSFVALFAIVISVIDFRNRKLSNWFDAILFGSAGVLGFLLLLLWLATDHKAAANNLNILWALPTHLIAVIAFIKQPKWLEKYFLIIMILTAVLLVSWPLLPQHLNATLIPFVLAIAIRSFTQYRLRKNP